MKYFITFILSLAAADRLAAAPLIGSPTSQPGVSASGNSFNPSFSADGRYLVFVSHANNLVTNDSANLSLDVFARDLSSSNTVLVSVSASGVGGANEDANYPSVSSNGQFIAFVSRASNLVAGDSNGAVDVFLRDVVNGTTRLVSVSINSNSPPDPASSSIIPLSGSPLVSMDGRWVFFESRATNLTAGGAPSGSVNIYARDVSSNTTVLVSADASGNAAGGKSRLTSISGDGRYASFITTNNQIVTGVANIAGDAYVRDLNTATTFWASTNASSVVGGNPYLCDDALLSPDGSRVGLVVSNSAGLKVVLLHDLATGTSTNVHSGGVSEAALQFSSDGRYLLWNIAGTAGVFDRLTGTTQVIGTPTCGCGGGGLGYCISGVSMSADGRYVAHRVSFGDPCIGPLTTFAYRTDLVAGTSNRVLVAADGTPVALGTGWSGPTISPDGSVVAFDSTAPTLVADDLNKASDIFLRHVDEDATELITKAATQLPAKTPPVHSLLGLNSISADGRFIVSMRFDDPSVARDTNGWADVFVTDLLSNTTVAVSVNSNLYFTNMGGSGGGVTFIENTNVYERPIISADGTAVFAVRRPLPGGGYLVTGASSSNGVFSPQGLSSVIRAPAGGFGNGISYAPSVSSNGQTIVFTTTAFDLVEGFTDFNGEPDVVLRRNGTNMYVSVALSGQTTFGASSNGILSADERWVMFESVAPNLTTNIPAGLALYARDLQSNITHRVSVLPSSDWAYVSGSAVFSGNSRYVVFSVLHFASADSSYLAIHDLLSKTTLTVDHGLSRFPSLSHNGRHVAYARRTQSLPVEQVYLRDVQGAEAGLISATPAGLPGNGASSRPQISGDGRYVVFESTASDLVANDSNARSDVFVRDTVLGATMLVSANGAGLPGNGPSSRPVIAGDGRTVAFQSFASDLVGGDYNDKRDIFVLKLGSPDTDGDGMDDDWEVAYFGNLSRNGQGDLDSDGASDLSEFLAGTDPGNSGSVFRVLTVMPVGGGSRQVIWTGNPARQYRVEFKDDVSAGNWNVVNGTISRNGATASIIDNTASTAHRYYRAVRLP